MNQSPSLSKNSKSFWNSLTELPFLKSGQQLLEQQKEQPQGLPSGWKDLDERLIWKGVPRAALSLLVGDPGTGATSFWLDLARRNGEQGRWSLWFSDQTTLFAPSIWGKGVSLKQLYVVRAPKEKKDLHFALRESLESGLFTLIGCEVSSLKSIRHELPQLKALAEKYQAAFVFVSSDPQDLKRTQEISWAAEFQSQSLYVHKAKSRPSFVLSFRGPYANLLSQLSQNHQSQLGRSLRQVHPPVADAGTRTDFWERSANTLAFPKFEKLA